MNSDTATPHPALVLISDPALRDEVRRIAAAADRSLDERAAPVGRHPWTAAPVVVLDLESARCCVAAGHPRRAGIVLVIDGEPGLLDWQIATEIGAERLLSLPAEAASLIAAFAASDRPDRGGGAVLAIAGAVGGAGASTLAAAVALTAATRSRDRTLLVDAAPYGGGLDLLLGLERAPGLRWHDLAIEDGRVAAPALHDALPCTGGVAVLSSGRGVAAQELAPAAVRSVLDAGRAAGDLVVCDLSAERGPHTDQILENADLTVLVVPARMHAVIAAESVIARLSDRNPNVRLLIRGPAPSGLRGNDVAAVLGLPFIAAVPPQPGLVERLERTGLTVRRRGPLRRAAEAVLEALTAPAAEPEVIREEDRLPLRRTEFRDLSGLVGMRR
ncbi:septum site-determining protein Ssd [Nocardia sp. NPDC051030]|uniref:septum site-determining protein Ssd n=1 Tax=Nocardia sp. NPDC051030 TaxID=3155162 RepID=UPI003421F05C